MPPARKLLQLIVSLGLGLALVAAPSTARAQFGFEGEPILIIESFSTAPNPIRSGQNFTLTLTVKNTGTKHADDIFAAVGGGAFVGLGAAVPVGKLDPNFSNIISLEVRAPSNLSSGAAELPIQFTYRIGESGQYQQTRIIGLSVTGGNTTTGKPQIAVEQAEMLSLPAVPGDSFDIRVTVRNVGTRRAVGVTASLKLNDTLSPAEGSGTTRLGDLNADATAAFNLTLVLSKASSSGRVLQTLALDYADADNRRYTSEETVGLDLGAAERRAPQLVITEAASDPARPTPGEEFTLNLRVVNVGAGEARRVVLRLGDEATGLKPFAPLGGSNVRFVNALPAGESAVITHTLLVDGAAEGGTYPVKVLLTYESVAGESQTEAEIVSLLVLLRPQLQIGYSEPLPEDLRAGEEFELPIEVVNVGRQRLNASNVEVVSRDLELKEASLYVGPLDAGTSGSLVARAVADKTGVLTVTVIVHYLDDFNREQTVTQPLTVTIAEAAPVATTEPQPDEQSWGERIWQAILGFFGLGGK
jgi:hypothetical protein